MDDAADRYAARIRYFPYIDDITVTNYVEYSVLLTPSDSPTKQRIRHHGQDHIVSLERIQVDEFGTSVEQI